MKTSFLPLRWIRLVLLVIPILLLFHLDLRAAEIKLARHPDYHDGKIAFSYLGDIWVVNEDGSAPRRITVHSARDIHPRFSPDGKWIAFSSARNGNYDVFVIGAEGGTPRQLTFNSATDTVVGWSRDSKRVIFSSARGLLFPGISNLYEVAVEGGLEQPVPTDWGYWGSYSPDGRRFAFNRHPMVWWRKHYRGSYSADLWVMDVQNRTSRKLLDETLPDDQKPNNFWPMYGNGEIYFVSDREVMGKAGSPEVYKSANNIWRISERGGKPTQVTRHKSGSLFWPSISSDGRTIVYEEDFRLWKLDVTTGRTAEVKIAIESDDKSNNQETLNLNSEADSFDLSPSTRRAVISAHGELFTIATDRGDISRLTDTPDIRETQPQWSPDGKWIAFVSDRSGRDEVWVCDERGGNAKRVSESDTQKGQLAWSPDSKALLYTATDLKLYKYAFESGKTEVLATGEVMGFGGGAIMNPQWSPDARWISYSRADKTLLPHVYVIPSEGGKEQRITDKESYTDTAAQWTPDGKRLIYLAGGDVGNIGQGGQSTAQLHSVSLTPEEKDPFDKGIDNEDQAIQAERQRPAGGARPRSTSAGEENPDGDETPAATPVRPRGQPDRKVEVKFDPEGIGRRSRTLTRMAEAVSNLAVSPDSRTYAFVAASADSGRPVQSIWTIQEDGERLTRIVQSTPQTEAEGPPAGMGGFGGFNSLQFSKDGRTLFYRQGTGIYSIALGTPSTDTSTSASPIGPAARSTSGTARKLSFTAKVEVDHRSEREQVFNESWRVMKHRFYDARMHGVDWDQMKRVYLPLLAYADDQEEMHNIVSQMIGELNASHTGISPGASVNTGAPQTRYPGFELAADPAGYYRVSHVYRNGPSDKDYVKIKTGDYIIAIDGHELHSGENYWKWLNGAAGRKIEFTVNSKPAEAGAWKTRVTPVSAAQYATLQYEKWVADRKAMVDRLSGGQIGYLHIRQMNEPSLRQFERDLAELHNKKALIIDQRFNPGGGIDQELLQILQQKQYQYTRVRDSVEVTRPLRAFFGPMVVMENERSTSDAEVFPDGFRALKLGKVVGVTTYGAVIGTGAYQLMDGSTIRTPGTGLWNVNGTNLENYGVPPDVYIDNTPEDFLKGRDAQIEKAVEVLQTELKRGR